MDIYNQCNYYSSLKRFYNDFVVTYLEPYYLEGLKIVEAKSEVEERALTYFVKSVSCIKSINTLFAQGDIVSARILMRSLFEVMIMFKKINKDKDDFVRYSKAYEKFKTIENCNIAIKQLNNDEGIDQIFYTKEELNNKIEEMNKEITELGFMPTGKENGRNKVNSYFVIKEMAIDVGMAYYYDTIYKNLCLDTHTSSSHFYKYLIVSENGKKEINLHPYMHELDLMIFTLTGIIMDYFEVVEEVLGIPSKCLANNQFKKLTIIINDLLPSLVQQGQYKKHGILAPVYYFESHST